MLCLPNLEGMDVPRFNFETWYIYPLVQNRMQEFNQGSLLSVTVEGVDELGPT